MPLCGPSWMNTPRHPAGCCYMAGRPFAAWEKKSSRCPGHGLPKPVAFPDPADPGVTVEMEGVRVVALEKLIELKLASGTSAPHRLRDMADVQDLTARLSLPLNLVDRLDSSVQPAYQNLWEKAHTDRPTNLQER